MNTKILKLAIIVVAALSVLCFIKYTNNLREKNIRLQNNQAVLLDSLQTYKVNDSINVSKINTLELSLSDYKKFRAEDAALIKKLKAGKLSSSISMSSSTNTKIETIIKDSIIYVDRIVPVDTVKQIKYSSYWTTIEGFISKDTLNVEIVNREELLIAQSYVNKRFLGIKLPAKVFGYRTKRLDAISKNPNTQITNLEFIQIYD